MEKEKYFSVGKAAEKAHLTAETLRHYDRIGLVRPSHTDKWTGYRGYTEGDLVRLNTVRALRCMELPLREIKEILSLEDMAAIVAALRRATARADEKIAELIDAKTRIGRATAFYEQKAAEAAQEAQKRQPAREGFFVREISARTILLADALSEATTGSLWNYHRHFYAQVGEARRELFSFEDAAGIFAENGRERLFAVCTRFAPTAGLRTLPAGRYLCAVCGEDAIPEMRRALRARAHKLAQEGAAGAQTAGAAATAAAGAPAWEVRMVVLTGILLWKYELQVYLGA